MSIVVPSSCFLHHFKYFPVQLPIQQHFHSDWLPLLLPNGWLSFEICSAKWDQKDHHHRDSRLCNCTQGATSSLRTKCAKMILEDGLTLLCRQEPDKATNARAVPIYATTVIAIGPPNWSKRVDMGNYRALSSMTALMALDFSVSRSSATSTAAL